MIGALTLAATLASPLPAGSPSPTSGCSLQTAQIDFTPHQGYRVVFYNPSPRAVLITGVRVFFNLPGAGLAELPTVAVPADKPVRVPADYAATVNLHGPADNSKRDPNLYDIKAECHDDKTEGNA